MGVKLNIFGRDILQVVLCASYCIALRGIHFMSGCPTVSDVDAESNHSGKVVTARFLIVMDVFPSLRGLTTSSVKHEALIGQYLPLDGIVPF